MSTGVEPKVLWLVRVNWRSHVLEFTPYEIVKETEKQFVLSGKDGFRNRTVFKNSMIGQFDRFFLTKEDGVRHYADHYEETARKAVAANEAFRRENYPLIAALPLAAVPEPGDAQDGGAAG